MFKMIPAGSSCLYGETPMTQTDIVDVAEGLVLAMRGEAVLGGVKLVQAPFVIVVPNSTNLDQQYMDGQDDLGTLKERLLRIKDVKDVRVSRGTGVSIEHFEG